MLLTAAIPAGIASSAATPHSQRESFQAFQAQLGGGRVHAATFNKQAHTLHLTLDDGRHALVSYPSREEPRIAAQLRAHGASVKVRQAQAKVVRHKLRYVSIAVLILVILFVAGVLQRDRRRRLPVEVDDEPAPRARSAVGPPPPPPAPAG
ncbi:MAG TPA: hypothetical protein VLJ42_07855 [Solirubrobacteraceae bacterium]|nr:hypothetical protein [Solirubrobacteraceae bacterium]